MSRRQTWHVKDGKSVVRRLRCAARAASDIEVVEVVALWLEPPAASVLEEGSMARCLPLSALVVRWEVKAHG